MENEELLCEEKCKYKREGRCILERLDFWPPCTAPSAATISGMTRRRFTISARC